MTNTFKKLTLVAVAIGTFAGPALAQSTPEGVTSVEVTASGYDLSSPKGVATLTRKARSTAAQICHMDEDRDLGRTMASKRCYTKAVADATRQIEALRLVRTAGRTGQQVAIADMSKLPSGK